MRIGARLAEQGSYVAVGRTTPNKVGYVCKVIRKRRFARRMRRRPSPPLPFPMALQELFVACREVFKGPGTVPAPQDVQRIGRILDDMIPEDVGLSSDLQFFNPKSAPKTAPRVSYTTIHMCDNFSLCMFFLPAGGVIPLHNHPGMTVFSKLLLGSMHIKSYDWMDPCDLTKGCAIPSPSKARPAKVEVDGVFTAPCKSSVLYPTTGGNIHEFKAVTPCAILDVLGPPYSKGDGRDCSYYRVSPCPTYSEGQSDGDDEGDGGRYGWLEEIEAPEDSQMDRIEYLGPQIMVMGC